MNNWYFHPESESYFEMTSEKFQEGLRSDRDYALCNELFPAVTGNFNIDKIQNCQNCKLSQTRKQVVLSTGSLESEVMFIGEAPGADEDEQGKPFIGRSGKLLRKLIDQSGMDSTKVYITNIVKCRPPNNRDPEKDEIQECTQHLITQIQIIHPKIVVCVGRIAMQSFLPDFKITRDHGKLYKTKNGFDLVGVYHPAYILRNPSEEIVLLNDLKQIKEMLQ